MKDMSLRNVLLLLAAVIVALLVLGFVGTLLNQLIPITIALVAQPLQPTTKTLFSPSR